MSDARRTMTKLAAFAALGTGVVVATGCQTPPAGFGGMTLPSGRYLQHPPQYFPPDPVFQLQNELNSQQQDLEGVTRRGGGGGGVAPLAPIQAAPPIPAGPGPAPGVAAPGAAAGMPK